MRFSNRLRRGAAVLAVLVLAACNGLTVDQRGVYTSAPTQTITGEIKVADDDTLVSLTVNGVDATVDGERYSAEIPLDGDEILNAVWSRPPTRSGEVLRERRTVVYGDGSHRRGAARRRRAERRRGPAHQRAVVHQDRRRWSRRSPPSTRPPSPRRAPCSSTSASPRSSSAPCTPRRTGAAPPTIADFGVALDSNQGNVRAVVTLTGLHIPIDVDARIARHPGELRPRGRRRLGHHRRQLRPAARAPTDPHFLDVNLVGATPTVTLGTVDRRLRRRHLLHPGDRADRRPVPARRRRR